MEVMEVRLKCAENQCVAIVKNVKKCKKVKTDLIPFCEKCS